MEGVEPISQLSIHSVAPPDPPPPPPPPPPAPELPPGPPVLQCMTSSDELENTATTLQLSPADNIGETSPAKTNGTQSSITAASFSKILQQHRQMLNDCHSSLESALRAHASRSSLDNALVDESPKVSYSRGLPPTPCTMTRVAQAGVRSSVTEQDNSMGNARDSQNSQAWVGGVTTALSLPGIVEAPANTKSAPDNASPHANGSTAVISGAPVLASTANATRAAKKAQEKMMKTLAHSKTTKFKKDGKHADDYLTAHARLHAENLETRLEQFVTSREYECASIAVIVLNCIFLCAQTQHIGTEMLDGRGQDAGRGVLWRVGNTCFCFVYAVDLTLRWHVDGVIGFFMTKDRWWNIFDVVIIGLAIVELGLDFAQVDQASHRNRVLSLSALRVLRVLRVVRILRLTNFFGAFFLQLRNMIHSLLQSAVNMFWVGMVFSFIWIVFGIVFTIGATEYCIEGDRWNSEETELLRSWFGTLDRSVISLFMAITSGRDWSEFYDTLADLPTFVSAAYLFYIWFLVIVAMNIVTGIFVEGAMKTAELDREFLIQQEMEEKERYVQSMERLFLEMDVSNSGGITLEEFEAHLNDERAIAYFNALQIDFSQAKTLFVLLDCDCSGSVDFQEFLAGCEKLQGNARSIDLAMLHYEVRWLASTLLDVRDSIAMPVLK